MCSYERLFPYLLHFIISENLLHLEDETKSPYITDLTSLSAAGSQSLTISPDCAIRRTNETAFEVNLKEILSYIREYNACIKLTQVLGVLNCCTYSNIGVANHIFILESINKSLEALPLISTALNDIKVELDMVKNRVDYAVINEEPNYVENNLDQLFPIQSGKVFLAMNEQLSNDSAFRMNFVSMYSGNPLK